MREHSAGSSDNNSVAESTQKRTYSYSHMILHSNEDFQCYEHEQFQVSRILDKDSTLHASEP